MKADWLVPEIQVVEGFEKQKAKIICPFNWLYLKINICGVIKQNKSKKKHDFLFFGIFY